jgi:hypothetical protein
MEEFHDVAAVSANDVWAVGHPGLIEHWDGTRWTVVAGAANYFNIEAVAAVAGGDLWTAAEDAPPTAHWDGATWMTVPILFGANLVGMAATQSGDFWTVGYQWSKPLVARLCPVRVSAAGFSPTTASGLQGGGVAWSFPKTNTTGHSVTDASGLGLFDSGLRGPGRSFTTTLIAAGSYPIRDSATGSTSTIRIPLTVKPSSGKTTTAFNLTWASAPPPPGYAFDVQIKRPGATAYEYWRKHTTDTSGAFTPDAGAGIYSLRARYRNTSNWSASWYSTPVTITVT